MDFNLEEVDANGAIEEAHEAAFGDTRLGFLKKAGLGAGAFIGGGAILGAMAGTALASGEAPGGAVGILNYALTLEYLEYNFYKEAAAHGIANGNGQLTHYLHTTLRDETNHVLFLKKALGSKAIKEPKFKFGSTVTNQKDFIATSYALENTGVHAYLGQAPYLTSQPTYLVAAASIVTIEARHSGAIAIISGKDIDTNGSFDKGYTYDQVIKIVEGTHFIQK